MDQRRSDPRIYIITLLFLSCIVTGGVLLGLYMLLSDPNPLFLQAGMVFVGLPWLFWFLAYIYSCVLKPCTVSVSKSVANFDLEKADQNNKIPEKSTSDSDPVTAMTTPREGEKKHVQFGDVMVIGDEEGGKEEEQENDRSNSRTADDDDCDRTPLRLSVVNK